MANARLLLAKARQLYDDPDLPFASAASHQAWQNGFESGAAWMRLVLSELRGQNLAPVKYSFQQLGVIKYGLAVLGSLLFLIGVILLKAWLLIFGVVLVFYAIEVQMVFLFPLALDGAAQPFRDSLRWTQKAGGTLPAMVTVMQLAVVMLFGGFWGGGFVRSWALGCLAVVLWYEELRHAA